MEEIAVSKFKATCLAVVDRVNKTGAPVTITKFGKPVAQLIPVPPQNGKGNWLGCMAGTFEIVGDIVSPACDPEDWEVLRD